MLLVPVAPDRALTRTISPHVLAADDVAGTASGHDFVLPWCTDSLAVLLARRAVAGILLSSGEAITLGVSVVRGTAAIVALLPDEQLFGEWWILDDGRPVLVPTDLGEPAVDASSRLLSAAADLCADDGVSPILREAASAIDAGVCDFDDTERALFAHGVAEPIAARTLGGSASVSSFASRMLGSTAGDQAHRGETASFEDDRLAAPTFAGRLIDKVRRGVSRHVDAALADGVGDALRAVLAVIGRIVPARLRRPVPIAVLTALVVFGIALALTSVPASSRSAPASSTSAPGIGLEADARTAPPTAAPRAEAQPSAAPHADGPDAALQRILEARATCAIGDEQPQHEGCESLLEPGVPPSVLDELPTPEATVSILDDLGGVVILKAVEPAGDGSEVDGHTIVVVLIETDDGWLVRDARGLPSHGEQPSE